MVTNQLPPSADSIRGERNVDPWFGSRFADGPARWNARWLWVLAALLAAYATALFAYGTWVGCGLGRDGDLQQRLEEYAWFRAGVYPNANLETHPDGRRAIYTVYPPYALPMFAFFFEPGGLLQGRLLVEGLSLTSLVLMGLMAFRTLAAHGTALAAVAAVSAAAIAGNATALSVGQFSIICVGLIVQQMIHLSRGQPLAAGTCWAMAMIKPQIALPFALLFLLRRQQIGVVVGGVILLALSLFASAWTDVTVAEILGYWSGGMSLQFMERGGGIGPGAVAKAFGVSPRLMLMVALLALVGSAVPLVVFARRHEQRAVLPIAGACAVAGMFFCYHRHYDNIMLFPTLLAMWHAAAASRRPAAWGILAALLVTLIIPKKFLHGVPFHEAVTAGVWIAAAAVPVWLVDADRRPAAETNAGGS